MQFLTVGVQTVGISASDFGKKLNFGNVIRKLLQITGTCICPRF